jgi:hypothetical protein
VCTDALPHINLVGHVGAGLGANTGIHGKKKGINDTWPKAFHNASFLARYHR